MASWPGKAGAYQRAAEKKGSSGRVGKGWLMGQGKYSTGIQARSVGRSGCRFLSLYHVAFVVLGESYRRCCLSRSIVEGIRVLMEMADGRRFRDCYALPWEVCGAYVCLFLFVCLGWCWVLVLGTAAVPS